MAYKPHKFIRDKLARRQYQKQFWKVFLIEAGLFFITSLLSIVSAFELNKLAEAQKIYLPSTSLQDFLLAFLIITLFVLLFVFNKKISKYKEIIYKSFFALTCFWGGMSCLNSFISVFGSVFVLGVLIILWLKKPTVLIHDLLIILGLAGAASFLGLGFNPAMVVALLVIFSFYDFIAVYKTKHMVAMAKEMIEKKVILGFIIPKEIKYFKQGLKDVKPGGNFLILGGGDVVFPSLLAVSVVPSSFLKAFVIIVFALAGSLLSYYLFCNQKDKEPIPALPPIALFAIVGYFITMLF